MSSELKYGLATLLAWNLLLFLAVALTARGRGVPFAYLFDDGTGGVGIGSLMVLWSCIWFGIGYSSRKKYLALRAYYREQAAGLDEADFSKAFRHYYLGKNAKMLSVVLITAVPWYALGYVHDKALPTDYLIMGGLALLAALLYGISVFWGGSSGT